MSTETELRAVQKIRIAIVVVPSGLLAVLWCLGAVLADYCGRACLAMEQWARAERREPSRVEPK